MEISYYRRRGYLGRLADAYFLNHAWKPGFYVTARLHINSWKPSYPFLDIDMHPADGDALVMRWFLEVWNAERRLVSTTADVSILWLLQHDWAGADDLSRLINRWSSHNVRRGTRKQLTELRAARKSGALKFANSYHEECAHLRTAGMYDDGSYWSPGTNAFQPFYYGCIMLYEPVPTAVLKDAMELMGGLPEFNAYNAGPSS